MKCPQLFLMMVLMMVVFGILVPCQVFAEIEAFGFIHTEIGNAQLSVVDSVLVADNLGGIGDDGFAVDVAGHIPQNYGFDFTTPSLTAIGANMRSVGIGICDGVPDRILGIMEAYRIHADTLTWTIDALPVQSESLTAIVEHNGEVIRIIQGLPALLEVKIIGPTTRGGVTWSYDIEYDEFGSLQRISYNVDWEPYDWGLVILDGVPLVVEPGKYLIDFLTINPACQIDDITRIEVTSDMDQILITDERIIEMPQPVINAFGFDHEPIGNADLELQNGQLVVSNLQGDGPDGVAIDIAGFVEPNHGFELFTSSLTDAGATARFVAYGTIEGIAEPTMVSDARSVAIEDNLLRWNIDLTPMEPTSVTAVVVRGGEVVKVAAGLPPRLNALIRYADRGVSDVNVDMPLSFSLSGTFLTAVFRAPDDEVLFELGPGDYLVDFIANNPAGTLLDYTVIDVIADMAEFRIVDETIIAVPPPIVSIFGFDNSPLGAAHLTRDGQDLVVTNLSDQGLDGFSVAVSGLIQPGQGFDFESPSLLVPGGTTRTVGVGLCGGVPDVPFAVLESSCDSADSLSWQLDLSLTGPSSVIATVIHNGEFVRFISDLPTLVDVVFYSPDMRDGVFTWSVDFDVTGPSANIDFSLTFATEIRIMDEIYRFDPGDLLIDFSGIDPTCVIEDITFIDVYATLPELRITDEIIFSLPVGVDDPRAETPAAAGVSGIYPNPSNPRTTIEFTVERLGNVAIEILDVRGRKIRTLIDEYMSAGNYREIWNGRDDAGRHAPSGVYFYRFECDEQVEHGKLTLVR